MSSRGIYQKKEVVATAYGVYIQVEGEEEKLLSVHFNLSEAREKKGYFDKWPQAVTIKLVVIIPKEL